MAFDRMHARMVEIRGTLDARAAVEAEESDLSRSRGRQTQSLIEVGGLSSASLDLATRGWLLGPRARPEHIAAAAELGFDYTRAELSTRALNSVTATMGQNTIPDEVMRAFTDALKYFVPIRDYATVIPTGTGGPLPIPTTDDTQNTGEIISDSGAVTTTADPTFGQVTLHPYKFSSKAVLVSVELLQDSYINLPAWMGTKLAQRIGRVQSSKFTVGTGTSEPKGIQVAATLGKTAASTTAITFDELIDLSQSVDVAYRTRPGIAFMAHDSTIASLRKVKDSQNRYIWEISTQVGVPDSLFGRPVITNNDMDQLGGANRRVALFGDLSAYWIQDAGPVVLIRADELFVLNHQVAFLGFQRSDGNLTDTTAVKYLRTP
jgi:HK97 family phage major capsid protein